MKSSDPDLDLQLDVLRDLVEPTPSDRQRVLDAVRATIDARVEPGAGGSADAPQRALANQSRPSRVAHGARQSKLGPWIGGALIGGAIGMWIGFGLARLDLGTSAAIPVASTATPGTRVADLRPGAAGLEPNVAEPDGAASPGTGDTRARGAAERDDRARGAATRDDSASGALERDDSARTAPASGRGRQPADSAQATRGANARSTTTRARAARLERAPAAPEALGLGEALEILHRAEGALHADEPGLALGLLGDLDRRAAQALLREERLTTLALALCALGRVDEARATRVSLEREAASSIYLSRLERSCAEAPPLPGRRRAPKN